MGISPRTVEAGRLAPAVSASQSTSGKSANDGPLVPKFANPSTNIFINEIHYDNTGGDVDEGVEIAGPAGTNLAGWTIVPYNGGTGLSYTPGATLTGVIPNQQSGMGTLNFPIAGLQNGAPDGLALVNGTTVIQFLCYEGSFAAADGPANGITCTGIGVDEEPASAVGESLQFQGTGSTYGSFTWAGPIAHTRGAANTGQTFTTPTDSAPFVQSTTPANNATSVAVNANISITFSEPVTVAGSWFQISCAASGTHPAVQSGGTTAYTLNPTTDFTAGEACTVTVVAAQVTDEDAVDPPDNMAANYSFNFVVAGGCGAEYTRVYTIQGSGPSSPMNGSVVITEGVVIGDFQGANQFLGFYVQDPGGDGNNATSDGIFVLSTITDVAVGDRVRVTGIVSEASNNTQINSVSSVAVCSTGNPTPAATQYDLPEPVNNDLERVENMLVTFPETLTVSENFTLGRFGELVLSSDGRMFQQNSFDRPSSPGSIAVATTNARRYVLLDDGLSIQNPDPTPYLDGNDTRRSGDAIDNLTGILTYSFNEYRVQPTGRVSFTSNPRPAAPVTTGNVKAASMNVLNYFNTFGAGNCTGGPGGTSVDCRGANNATEFTRQRDKIIAALIAINPDAVGFVEMENDGIAASSAIQDLVDGLNAASAPGTYAFVAEPNPGTDAIKVSIIYKPGALTPDGPAVNDINSVWNNARPPLAQTFLKNSTTEKFTLIVNHFKSKGGACPSSGSDADLGDGQGCFNGSRSAQAQRLLVFIQDRKAAAGDPDVLTVGDYNAYAEEDPIVILEDDASDDLGDGPGGLYSQTKRFVPAASRYSFVFDAESGELDHALATKTMHQQIVETFIWHNNADEPLVLDYNQEFKSAAQQALNVGTPYRTADHDPLVIGIDLLQPTAADGRISGRIADHDGIPIAGAVVGLSGGQSRKTITDANGNYAFDNVETNAFYIVTPSRANYSFGPASRSFTQLGNSTEAAFTGSPLSVVVNPLDTPEYFVRQHYLDFLGREPDEAGFNFWSDEILACGGQAACREAKRIHVSAAYFLSIEFQRTGGLVDGLYRASYGRAPRFAEFMPDTAALSQNVVVGQGDWEGQLLVNKRAFSQLFVNRASFRAVYDSLSNDGYVNKLTSQTGVSFSATERDALVGSLNSGSASRAEVLLRIAENESFMQAKRNAAFVMMEYFGYLRRDPDQSGYEFWLDKLEQFGGNFERAEMVKAFINSIEYRARFQR